MFTILFTTFCEKNNPELVVETLQDLVEKFEKAFEDFGLEVHLQFCLMRKNK